MKPWKRGGVCMLLWKLACTIHMQMIHNTHANIREHLNNRHVLVAACYFNL